MMAEENVAPGVAVVALLILSELASSATLKPVDHEDALDERDEQLGPQRRFCQAPPVRPSLSERLLSAVGRRKLTKNLFHYWVQY